MRSAVLAAASALLVQASVATAQEVTTYFDYVETSYVVAEAQASPPIKYRDGRLLEFPTKITDILHARVGKPQTLMIVYELKGDEKEAPFPVGAPFFAPIVLMPQYSYWRDNLPKTPHHQIVGGKRYIFRGDEIAEAKRITKPFAASLSLERAVRWPDQAAAVVEALGGSLPVLREDATRYLATHDVLLAKMRPETRTKLFQFLESDAASAERARIIDALAHAKVTDTGPALEKLAQRDEPGAVAALRALDEFGSPRDKATLDALTSAKTEEVRAYAFETMGARAGNDPDAFARVSAELAGQDSVLVRGAAARGLGKSRNAKALEPLTAALARGDEASKDAALAIAVVGGPGASDILKKTIAEGNPDSMAAAVVAIVQLREECSDCLEFLRHQHANHPDKSIRDLIGIMLELNKKHEH